MALILFRDPATFSDRIMLKNHSDLPYLFYIFFPSKKRDINGNPKKTRIVLSIKDRWRYANLEKWRSGPYLTRRFNV